MIIVCGTDFSPRASQAADAAAAIAARLTATLHLVHVVDALWPDLAERAQAALLEDVRGRLRAEADRLRPRGVAVEETMLFGLADEALVSHAQASDARLLVAA